jgi:hypothetical protein
MRALLVFLGILIGVSLSSSRHWFNPHRIAGKAHLREFPVRLADPVPLDPEAHSGGLVQQRQGDGASNTTVTTLLVVEQPSPSSAVSPSPEPSPSQEAHEDLVADTKRAVQELERLQGEAAAEAAAAEAEAEGETLAGRRRQPPRPKTFTIEDGVVRPGMLEHVMYVRAGHI